MSAAHVRGVGGVIEMLRAGAEGVGVGEHGVDLPLLAGRPGYPHFLLGGEAAGRCDLLVGEQSLAGQPGDLGMDSLAGGDLDAEGFTFAGAVLNSLV